MSGNKVSNRINSATYRSNCLKIWLKITPAGKLNHLTSIIFIIKSYMTTGEFHACLESNANLQTNKASKEVIPTISQHFVHSMKWKKKRVPK